MVRVLAVEPKPEYQEWFKDVINSGVGIDLIFVAIDVESAVSFSKELMPDLVLIGPGLNFEDARALCENLALIFPSLPVLMVSRIFAHDEMFAAMSAGALDVLPFTLGTLDIDLPEKLRDKIKLYAEVNSLDHGSKVETKSNISWIDGGHIPAASDVEIVAIGASTGGPQVIHKILAPLPVNFPCAIVIVQHLPPHWGQTVVDWLSERLLMPVKLVRELETPEPGVIYVADPVSCWELTSERMFLSLDNHLINKDMPSIDTFFLSVAKHYASKAIGIILTGMGADGAKGLNAMKQKGAFTIVQEEQSCMIFGMPRKALSEDPTHVVLDPLGIRTVLLNLARGV